MNLRITAFALTTIIVAACGQRGVTPAAQQYDTATVEKRPLVLTVEAAGVIEPVRTVEIKSKASGEILELGADTGDTVKKGALLARIDPRTPRNRLDQAAAQLNAALARSTNARSQLDRGKKLLGNAWINQADYDKLVLDAATAESEVVTARIAVDNARISLDDTEVRAPSDGTILYKKVERGQVISSPTMDVGGGTLLMTMADLSRVRRAFASTRPTSARSRRACPRRSPSPRIPGSASRARSRRSSRRRSSSRTSRSSRC